MNEHDKMLDAVQDLINASEGQPQPDTLLLPVDAYRRVCQIARELWLARRAGRRRSRHCRSKRPRAIRRTAERARLSKGPA